MGRSLRLAAIGSASAALLAVATLGWAAADAVRFLVEVFEHRGGNSEDLAHLLGTLDLILIATTLLIVAAGVWELFVSDITLPHWLEVRSLTELKTKVVDSLILVLAVNFLEHLVGTERPLDLLWRGLATASVGVLLVAFGIAKGR